MECLETLASDSKLVPSDANCKSFARRSLRLTTIRRTPRAAKISVWPKLWENHE